MSQFTRTFALLAVLLMGSVGLTACNTVEGVGEDVEAAGSAVDRSAERNKSY